MGRHRSRLKILANILFVIRNNNGAKKTQIMYQAYLSYKLLIQYLHEVTEFGLVNSENESYTLTSKGEKFLEKFDEYNKQRDIINEHLIHISNQKSTLEAMCDKSNLITHQKNTSNKIDLKNRKGSIIQ